MVKIKLKTVQSVLAYAGLFLAVFFWAINTVIAKAVVLEIKPMALSFYRWFVAFVFILPFALPHFKKDFNLIRKNLGFLSILAFPSVAAYNSILYIGAQYTTATNIAMVVVTMPVMTILFSWIINREKPYFIQAAGVTISLFGMLIIIIRGSWQVLHSFTFNIGDLLIVLSIASWAFYSVMLKKRKLDISPISFLTVLICLGTLCILPFYLWEFAVFGGFKINTTNIYIFLYLGICPSILSYICWNYGVKIKGASTASVFMCLLPIFTSIIAYLFLGESLFPYHLLGGLFIATGMILSVFK